MDRMLAGISTRKQTELIDLLLTVKQNTQNIITETD
jgi:hypothetical protein